MKARVPGLAIAVLLGACFLPTPQSSRVDNATIQRRKARDPRKPPSPNDALETMASPKEPAVKRGGMYAGFVEEFNRYYTDPTWRPTKTLYVSPRGGGNGSSPSSPAFADQGLAKASPGTRVVFAKGTYNGCFGFEAEGGTYDAPIVLYAERNADGSRGVRINCCKNERESCFNFEAASYIAVDGFELRGGRFGVRAVGIAPPASQHSRGIAVLDSWLDGQNNDGVLTGASDWDVFERNLVTRSGEGDGHGIYLSNGSDWNIVRNNDLHSNEGATFQINADPLSTCDVTVNGPDCDGLAGSTEDGGRGASDFMLVENNYFHHGNAQGSNFTSMRYSVVRNNAFGPWARHGVSFWSETADASGDPNAFNPNLGSHHNRVHHNLFVSSNESQMLQFIGNSNDCDVRNNLFVGLAVDGTRIKARTNAVFMETDATVKRNVYEHNMYIAGKFDGRPGPTASEVVRQDLDAAWFAKVPTGLPSAIGDWAPRAGAPFLDKAPRLATVPLDRDGKPRGATVDLGPFEVP